MRIFFYSHIHTLTKYLLNFHDVSSTVLYAEEEKKKEYETKILFLKKDGEAWKKIK